MRLTVRDRGPGIPSDERKRVFQRFYRLERSRTTPGNGLGLSLVQAVGQLHGAEVALIERTPGLAVEFRFPAMAAETGAAVPGGAPAPAPGTAAEFGPRAARPV